MMRRAVPVILFAGLLSGCGETAKDFTHSGTSTSSVTITRDELTTEAGSGPSSTTTGAMIVEGWAPPPVPIPKDLEYREKLGPYADMMLRGGLVPYASEEHVSYVVSCIESAGFAVTVDSVNGSIKVRTGDQVDQYRHVMDACEQAVVDSGLVAPLAPATQEFLAAQYQKGLVEYRCLADHGFTPSDPPAEQTFLESAGWDPFSGVGSAQFEAAERACRLSLTTFLEQLVASGQAIEEPGDGE